MGFFSFSTGNCLRGNSYAEIMRLKPVTYNVLSQYPTQQFRCTLRCVWGSGNIQHREFNYTLSYTGSTATKLIGYQLDSYEKRWGNVNGLGWKVNTDETISIYLKGIAASNAPCFIEVLCNDDSTFMTIPDSEFVDGEIEGLTYILSPYLFDSENVNLSNIMCGSIYNSSEGTHNITLEGYNGSRVHYVELKNIVRGTGQLFEATVIVYQGGIVVNSGSSGLNASVSSSGLLTVTGVKNTSYLIYTVRR